MKCSNCGNEMTHSLAGWLCISCGHIESGVASDSISSTAATPSATSQPEASGSDAPAESNAEPAAEQSEPTPQPEPATEPEEESSENPESAEEPPPPSTGAPWETAPVEKPDASDEAPVAEKSEPEAAEPEPDTGAEAKTTPAVDSLSAPASDSLTESDPGQSESEAAEPKDNVETEPSPANESSPTPLGTKPPLTPTTHPRPFHAGRFVKATVIALGSLVIAGTAAGAGYLYMLAPNQALSSYLQRVVSAKTSTFAGELTSSADDYRLTLKLDGKNDVTDIKNPKTELGLTGDLSLSGSVASSKNSNGSVSARMVVSDQQLFFKLLSVASLSELLPANASQNWYKFSLTTTTNDKCMDQSKNLSALLSSNSLARIPVKDASFIGFEAVGGEQSLHYRGTIDTTKLQDVIEHANQSLAAECKIDIPTDDYKDVTITYDLWQGWGKDRIKLGLTDADRKAVAEITLNTAGYNQPVAIEKPTDAKSFDQLLSDIQTKTLGAATERSVSIRDDVRKVDLARLRTETDAYAAAHKNTYPATAAAVAKLNFSGIDPTTLKPYAVVAGQPNVGQIQYRRSAKCDPATGNIVAIKPTKSRTYAVATKLESGANYCLDHQ